MKRENKQILIWGALWIGAAAFSGLALRPGIAPWIAGASVVAAVVLVILALTVRTNLDA